MTHEIPPTRAPRSRPRRAQAPSLWVGVSAIWFAAAAGAAAPPPERATEGPAGWVQGPLFYCANGIGIQLNPRERMKVATEVLPSTSVSLGPVIRFQLAHVEIEVQWPNQSSESQGTSQLVFRNTRLNLAPISEYGWALSMEPGNPYGPEELSLESVTGMIVVRFPAGEHSGEGLEFARRLEYVRPDDRRCSTRN